MAASTRAKLGIGEKVDLGIIILSTVMVAIRYLLTSPFRGQSGVPSIGRHVLFAALRNYFAKSSARQLQSTSPTTDEVYLTEASNKGFKPQTVELPLGGKAHWIGNSAAAKVIVMFHGGGYVLPAGTHVNFGCTIQHQLGPDTAVVVLSYSLAPQSQYPTQLKQAVDLLRYLIKDVKKDPENIILLGDSAGGNLALGVLSHIMHPHSQIERLHVDRPLRALALISPWGDFSQSEESFQTKEYKDLASTGQLKKWSDYFMGDAKSDDYNQPFNSSTAWWKDLEKTVGYVFISAGGDEILTQAIQKFAAKVKKLHSQVTLIVPPGEAHDLVFLGPVIGDKEDCESKKALIQWLKARLASSTS